MSASEITRPDVVRKASISLALAQRIIASAMAKADELGPPSAVAVVDESGILKAFARMDGAPVLALQVAQDKAYTAAGFAMATDAWYDFIKDDGPMSLGAPGSIDRLMIIGGGYPITVDGELIGAVGVSGGQPAQDMEVAQAGLAAVGR